MEHVVIPLLIVLVLLSIVTIFLVGLLWWQHNALSARVAAIERGQLSHADARQIYERLATVEGQIGTNLQVTRSISKHLLEAEK